MKTVIANLKMNLILEDIKKYKKKLEGNNYSNEIVICPSSLFLPFLISNKYSLGAQNMFYEEKGAYTGEISANQLKSIKVKYVILGHSERRTSFNESNILINKKIITALNNNLIPIVCIGEKEKNSNTYELLNQQIEECFRDITDLKDTIIAYEPIWAIGSGITPTNLEIQNTISYIKEEVFKKFNKNIKVIYGGSINENNISEIDNVENNDGFLIGTASNDINQFINIINKIK